MIRVKQISYYAAAATSVNGYGRKCTELLKLGIQKRGSVSLQAGVKHPLGGRVTTYFLVDID
jgi:hypothetical protein